MNQSNCMFILYIRVRAASPFWRKAVHVLLVSTFEPFTPLRADALQTP